MSNHLKYSWDATLAASLKVNWKLEDVLPADARLDFSKQLLPESLARTEGLSFLTGAERLALNHVRANGYLATFGLVEEFILPFVLEHARPRLRGESPRVRALLQFAVEEAKHIELFRRFQALFERDFGVACEVIGPPEAIAAKVLSHHPLAIALLVLQIEWMTQKHYVEGVQDRAGLDPLFSSLLRNHWLEEAQHAKLDTLMVEMLAERCGPEERRLAVEEYLDMVAFLDAGLGSQAALDLASFETATSRKLTPAERTAFLEEQHAALRWTFIGSGMTHPSFLGSLQELGPALRRRVEQAARPFVADITATAA